MYRCQESKSMRITFPSFQSRPASQLFSPSFQVFSALHIFSLTPNLPPPPILPSFSSAYQPHQLSLWEISLRFSPGLSENQIRIKGERSGSITLRPIAVWVHVIIWSLIFVKTCVLELFILSSWFFAFSTIKQDNLVLSWDNKKINLLWYWGGRRLRYCTCSSTHSAQYKSFIYLPIHSSITHPHKSAWSPNAGRC